MKLLRLAPLLSLLAFGACRADAPARIEPPPLLIEAAVLAPQPIEETSEYLATLSSRRAITLYPRVSGYVREILVTPGQKVRAGTPLLVVDPSTERASLDNLVATRASLAASASYARDHFTRQKTLRADGIVSQQDLDQARTNAEQAEATLRASDAQIASQRARLGQYSILAPFEGMIGDVPVKLGDFVSPSTVLSSITEDARLEAYVSVPVERVKDLTTDSQIRLVASDGVVIAEGPVTFVSPRADPSTQLVLLKASFPPLPSLRPDQVVRARVVWSRRTGLSLPTSAVMRQAGQYFAFVVEAGAGDVRTVKRVAIGLGDLHGNDYAIERGLEPGQRIAVSGIRQLADGTRVTLKPDSHAGK
ncbi:MAG: efflux RND transporter periplasmic adaptor subunit [Polyangiales bacterium]